MNRTNLPLTDWLAQLSELGVKFGIDKAGGLTTRAPKGTLTAPLVDEIKARKAEILTWLSANTNALPDVPTNTSTANHLWPLSEQQERLWFACQETNSSAYQLAIAIKLKGTLATDQLENAINATLARHRILSTNVVETQGRVAQRVNNRSLKVHLKSLKNADQTAIETHTKDWLSTPMSLETDPLCRVELVALSDKEHLLLMQCHHLVTDGATNLLLLQEMLNRFQQLPVIDTEPYDYLDYCLWQQLPEVQDHHLSQVNDALAGLKGIEPLAFDPQMPPQSKSQAAQVSIACDAQLDEALDQLAKTHKASRFACLLSAWQLTLFHLSDNPCFAVASPTANRHQHPHLIGFMVNTQLFGVDISKHPSLSSLISANQQQILKANTQADLPFFALTDALTANSEHDAHAYLQAAISYDTDNTLDKREITGPAGEKITLEALVLPETGAKFPLMLLASDREALSLAIDYDTGIFTQPFIERVASGFRHVLSQLISLAPKDALNTLSLLTDDEHKALTGSAISNDALPEPYQTIVKSRHHSELPAGRLEQLIESQVTRTPDAIAISCEHHQFTYREMDTLANRLARTLLAQLPEGEFIGVCADRSSYLSIALLSVLKAGRAYLPIDPDLPDAAIDQLLDDAKPPLILCDENTANRFQVPTIQLDAPSTWLEGGSKPDVPGPSPLLNLIYTSGSTGKPKGVMVPHTGIINRLCWMQQAYPLTSSDRILQKTPFNFDVSVWEFFWPLMVGASVHLAPPKAHQDTETLLSLIHDRNISTVHFVPSVLGLFLQTLKQSTQAPGSLKRVFASGEALLIDQVDAFYRLLPNAQLHNLYGPTEASIDVSYFDTRELNRSQTSVPIGKPIVNTQLLVLNKNLMPCLPGISGELYIGGENLAHGYWQRPELTKACFIPHPFDPGQRLYKTGDQARWLEDGNLEYLGRTDNQLKIRGVRVEADAIRHALIAHSDIDDATVITEGAGADKLLTAFYVTDHQQSLDTQALRDWLLQHLPAPVIPQRFIHVEALPLTANGKLNRRELQQMAARPDVLIAPATDTERRLLPIWQEQLGLPNISCEQNFFELGGHSLLAGRLTAAVSDAFNINLHLADLLQQPTIQLLAAFIDTSASSHVEIPISDQLQAPLSYQQRRLFLFWQLQKQSSAYHMPASFRLSGQIDVSRLQAAFDALVERHSILRTCYQTDKDGTPYSVITEKSSPLFSIEDLSASPSDLKEWQARIQYQPFDLSKDWPIRAALIKLADNDYRLLLCLHHIAADAESFKVMLSDLVSLYQDQNTLLPLPLQYKDFAVWQQSDPASTNHDFWKNTLHGAPELLNLPLDGSRNLNTGEQADTLSIDLPQGLVDRIRRTSKEQQCTPFTVMLSAYQLLLSRLARSTDIAVGLPVSGRSNRQLAPLIGFFVNSLIMRSQIGHNPNVSDWLSHQQQALTEIFRHQDIAIESVIESLGYQRRADYLPIAQVGFNYLQANTHQTEHLKHLLPFEIEPLDEPVMAAKYEMTWTAYETGDKISLHIEYQTSLYHRSTIAQWADWYLHLLGELTQNQEQPLASLNLEPNSITEEKLLAGITPNASHCYPLSPMQQDIYLDSRMNPESRQNSLGFISATDAPLDPDIWQNCLKELVQSADTLRALVVEASPPYTSFYQAVVDDTDWVIQRAYQTIDLTHQKADETQINALAEQLVYRAFSDDAPLWRAQLLRFANNHTVFILAGHHALFDGVSLQMLGRLLKNNYEATAGVEGTILLQPANNYQALLDAGNGHWNQADTLAFWQSQKLQAQLWPDFTPTGLKEYEHSFSANDTQQLVAWCRKHRTTPALYLKALYALCIKHLQGFDGDFVIEEAVSGRDQEHLTTIGLMFEQQPIVIDAAAVNESFTQLLRYLSRWRKTIKSHSPLSPVSLKTLLPTPVRFVFNFYLMETNTTFMGQSQRIDHRVPEQLDCVTLISRQDESALTLTLSAPNTLPVNEHLLHRFVQLHHAIMTGTDNLKALPWCESNNDSPFKDVWQTPVSPSLMNQGVIVHDSDNNYYICQDDQFHAIHQGARAIVSAVAVTSDSDRKAAPVCEGEMPSSEVEAELLHIWQQVLGRTDFGVTDDFFALGGHSLLAMQIAHKIQHKYPLNLSVGDLFEATTVRTLANLLTQTAALAASQLPALPAPSNEHDAPLSYPQQRLWLFEKVSGASQQQAIYNLPMVVTITGELHVARLKNAIQQTLEKHESLRTFLFEDGGSAKIRALDAEEIQLEEQHVEDDLSAEQVARDWIAKPFRLGEEALVRMLLLNHRDTDEPKHTLAISIHHLIADGPSMQILAADIFAAYTSQLPAHETPTYQYSDFARWQQSWMDSDVLTEQLAFWKDYLKGAPLTLGLPYDRRPAQVADFHAEQIQFSLDAETSQALRNLASEQQVSPFMLLLGIYQLTLHLHSHQQDLCVGIPVNGRSHSAFERAVGFFVNALVIRTPFVENLTFEEQLRALRNNLSQAFNHQHVPAEAVMQALDLHGSLAQLPIVQAAFNFVQGEEALADIAKTISLQSGLRIEPLDLADPIARFECTLTAVDNPATQRIECVLDYRKALFNQDTMQAMVEDFCQLSKVLAEDASQTLYQLRSQRNQLDSEVGEFLPLTPVQNDLYLASVQRPESLENSIGYALHLPVALDVDLFRESFNALVDHYPMLRAEALKTGRLGYPQLSMTPQDQIQWQLIDCSDTTPESIQQTIESLIRKPYRLEAGADSPLLTQYLIKESDHSWYIALACHHLLMDGLSYTLHAYHWVSNYLALTKQQSMTFADDAYAEYQQKQLQIVDRPDAIAYWQAQCADAEALIFDGENPDSNQSLPLRTLHLDIPDEHHTAIKAYCRSQRITPALYFKCLYGLFIDLYCAPRGDFMISEFLDGRTRADLGSIGCHFHRGLWRYDQTVLSGTLSDLFSAAKKQQKAINRVSPISISAASRMLPQGLSFSYNYLYMPKSGEADGISFDGRSFSPEYDNNIDFRVQLDKGNLQLAISYTPAEFADHRMLERMLAVSKQIVSGAESSESLNFLLADEIPNLTKFNSPPVPGYWAKGPVHEIFRQQAEKSPDSMAVIAGDSQLTYKALNQQSNHIANLLNAQGIGRDGIVALYMPKGINAIVALLGILKTGAAYLPIDSQYARDRVTHMLNDANIKALLVDQITPDFDDTLPVFNVNEMLAKSMENSAETVPVQETDPCYAIYTTGSTGLPKAAFASHGAVANLVNWYIDAFSLTASDKHLVISALGFDLTQKNLLGSLCAGATLVLYTEQQFDDKAITQLITSHRITRLNAAPSAISPLLDRSEQLKSLKTLWFGGEPLHAHKLKPIADSDIQVVNMYGLSECTDISLYHHWQFSKEITHIPLGLPSPGNSIQLLSRKGQSVPPGIGAELVVQGLAVGKPANETSSDGFRNDAYYTGDRAYWQLTSENESSIIAIGRDDGLQKHHGVRFHPATIESAIEHIDGIKDACVIKHQQQLLAFYRTTHPIDEHLIRQTLYSAIPIALIPNHFAVIDQWPLNAHGKRDTAALVDYFNQLPEKNTTPPRNATEKRVHAIWTEVLAAPGQTSLDIHQSFFEAGGDSLLALRLIQRLEQEFNVSLPVSMLFQAPTIATLASWFDKGGEYSPLTQLTYATQANAPVLIAMHGISGLPIEFRHLAQSLNGEMDVYGLQSPGLNHDEALPENLDALLEIYSQAIAKRFDASVPLVLVGHSLGGIFAMELCMRLEQQGTCVEKLILLDTFIPAGLKLNKATLTKITIESITGQPAPSARQINQMFKKHPGESLFLALSDICGGLISPERFANLLRVSEHLYGLLDGYQPTPPISYIQANTLIIQAQSRPLYQKLAIKSQSPARWIKSANVKNVSGDHITLLTNPDIRKSITS